jgi:hypothetical protein
MACISSILARADKSDWSAGLKWRERMARKSSKLAEGSKTPWLQPFYSMPQRGWPFTCSEHSRVPVI